MFHNENHDEFANVPTTAGGVPNRLDRMRGYLCGAMDRVKDGGEQWRIELQRELAYLNVFWLDPTHKPIDIGIEDIESREEVNRLKRAGAYGSAATMMKPTRCVDLRMVDLSDFLVVNLDMETHACGTYEEMFLANRQKKPVIVRVEQGKEETPNWLLATLPHQLIFSTWKEVAYYLRFVAHGKCVDPLDRWFFFNYDMCRKFDADGNLVDS